MKISPYIFLLVFSALAGRGVLYAQDNAQSCKVRSEALAGTYNGECKDGLAHGVGEARGVQHSYSGLFKKGMPEGKGVYTFSETKYYSGNFLEGKKEGKGEMHYLRTGIPDSIIKGYWSGDEYKGDHYTTYSFDGAGKFDHYEISPTPQGGNSITIEIATTTGSPDGTQRTVAGGAGYVLTLTNLISTNGVYIQKMSQFASTNKFTVTYQLNEFPVRLYATLSSGESFSLELYKSATWRARFYVNK